MTLCPCSLRSPSAAVESTGQAKAEAQSRAEASKIEGEASVQQAKLKSEATSIEAVSSIVEISLHRSVIRGKSSHSVVPSVHHL